MDQDTDLFPSSPTNSSPTSSDLDTEVRIRSPSSAAPASPLLPIFSSLIYDFTTTQSTGSLFHDRSTTLGTLMGLTFPEISARPTRTPSGPHPEATAAVGCGGSRETKPRRRRRRRVGGQWWRLCRDDMAPTSLEEYLRAERRLGAAEGHFLYGGEAPAPGEVVGSGKLFEDGRVLPPPLPADTAERRKQRAGEASTGSLGRLPVLIAGICSGGEG